MPQKLSLLHVRTAALRWRLAARLRAHGHARLVFPQGSALKLLLLTQPDAISQSQIFPFYFYSPLLRTEHGVSLRELSLEAARAAPHRLPAGADVVVFQLWMNASPDDVAAVVALVRSRYPYARLVFFDPLAPTDLRMAASIGPHVDLYVKKHVLRDRAQYGRATLGDTNLTDWYGRRYGHVLPTVVHAIPPGFLDKLVVGPTFFTADYMLPTFFSPARITNRRDCRFDVHARLGGVEVQQSWYGDMRREAASSLAKVARATVTPTGKVSKSQYLREMQDSRICFSPFGYGEVCWRDYEAIMFGSLLFKQDMSHLETDPDIFLPMQTYVPLAWDFSDLPERLEHFLTHPRQAGDIVKHAYRVLHSYVAKCTFATSFVPKVLGR